MQLYQTLPNVVFVHKTIKTTTKIAQIIQCKYDPINFLDNRTYFSIKLGLLSQKKIPFKEEQTN